MRVIHVDETPLAVGYRLQASGHGIKTPDALCDHIGLESQGHPRPGGAEDVFEVVPPNQR